MKLSKRITLLASAVLAVVIVTVTVALLLFAKQTILDLSIEQTEEKHRTLCTSFSEMANYYATEADSEAVHASLVDYCFSRFADQTAVLMRDGEPLYTGVTVDPSAFVPVGSGAYAEGTAVACRVNGSRLLIVGRNAGVRDHEYSVYIVEDITPVYARIGRMAWIFAAVSIFAVGAGAAAVAMLMKRSTKPISSLAAVSREIADGAYEKRADVRTKDEVGLLAADFNRMADAVESKISELEERNERQRLFISGVTHEFKTPLTGLLLHAGLLRRANLSEAERDVSLWHIETQTAWLERLVQTLLKLLTLDREIETQTVELSEFLEQIEQGIAPKLSERGATLDVQCEADTLCMNADLIQSLLFNLISNAINSYDLDAPDKPVMLRVFAHTVAVSDHGRGIPKEALPRIFEPFYMVDKSRSKKLGGSGLGLALVRAIADAHHASITVESEPGEGTTVSVVLP